LGVVDTEMFVQAAPFLGINTENVDSPGIDDASQSLLCKVTASLSAKLQSHAGTKAREILQDVVNSCWKADQFYRPPKKNMSVFKSALGLVDKMVSNVKQIWANPSPDNGVLAVDSTTEFYRLWSALQFLFCVPQEKGPSLAAIFGDGFPWAGMTLIYFLRQHHRFQVFDFSYHVINVEEAIPSREDPVMKSLFAFLPLATEVKELNQEVLNTLKVYYPIEQTEILILHPPTEEHGTEFITSLPGAASFGTQSTANTANLPRKSFEAPPSVPDEEEEEEVEEKGADDEFAAPSDAPPPLPRDS